MERLANFGTFAHYFVSGLWDNRVVNWVRYDLFGGFPPPLPVLRAIGIHKWREAYHGGQVGWTLVARYRAEWEHWMLRLGGYALACTYHHGRLVGIRRFDAA